MQALRSYHQFRVALCVALAPLTFPLGFSNALPSTPELHHKSGLLVLCKRTGYVAHHDPAKGGSFFSAANVEGPRERARHHRGLVLALPGSQGLRLGAFDSA